MTMLRELIRQVNEIPLYCDVVDCSAGEIDNFKREHPNTDFVIGDFEIRCINPAKYGLPPRQP